MSTLLVTKATTIRTILNSAIEALKKIMPNEVKIAPPSVMTAPVEQLEMGVLIGLIGDTKGRLLVEGDFHVFSAIGQLMYGMKLDGEMLESFTGEFGNMTAGNLCIFAGEKGLTLDITPPTVMVGSVKLYGFSNVLRLGAEIEGIGKLTLYLNLED